MSLAPAIAGTIAATNTSGITLADHVFIYIGAAVLFGLIGLVPLLAEKPESKPTPGAWDVVDDASEDSPPRIAEQPMTIDGEITEVRKVPKLTRRGPRLGR